MTNTHCYQFLQTETLCSTDKKTFPLFSLEFIIFCFPLLKLQKKKQNVQKSFREKIVKKKTTHMLLLQISQEDATESEHRRQLKWLTPLFY